MDSYSYHDQERRINWVAASHGDHVYAGTAGAHLLIITAKDIELVDTFDRIPERTEWNSPWGGPPDVRSLAVSLGGVVYANIQVGWIARSKDEGDTWEALRSGLEKDVHQVRTHPSSLEIVFAATADGFYISRDLGDSFAGASEPMEYYYQRVCVCIPGTETFLVSTSRGPHGTAAARVYRSTDAGLSRHLTSGLPELIENNIDTFHLAADDDGSSRRLVAPDLPKVHAVLTG